MAKKTKTVQFEASDEPKKSKLDDVIAGAIRKHTDASSDDVFKAEPSGVVDEESGMSLEEIQAAWQRLDDKQRLEVERLAADMAKRIAQQLGEAMSKSEERRSAKLMS